MLELKRTIAKFARSQAPVFICGDSGTGKELVARQIHLQGSRAEAAFIAVNCGAIPSELMESEFFGHRKGSFTGAVHDKVGLVQTADSGTLFLDEIADLPLSMQVKLLRVIQEQTIRPVGSSEEQSVDVRILSATHNVLSEMVASGDFREDLYYRINVIELHVPSLRERGDDILMLAGHILARLGSSSDALDASARATLSAYHFPGNVRELENMLERAVTLCASGTISESDLAVRIGSLPEAGSTTATTAGLGDQVEDVQRQAIVEALQQTRYNKTAAAKLLGVTFRQLRYRIKKLGIE
jgi:two-component system response regulator PilR (NtrC family)